MVHRIILLSPLWPPLYSRPAYHHRLPPFQKHSKERYQRDKWVFKSQLEKENPYDQKPQNSSNFTTRDYEIAIQLPELKNLLKVLKEKRLENNEGLFYNGNVYLVGTGPGDPDLLTLKALKVIKKADLVLYDRLVSNDVLDLVGPDAKLLYVGKTAGYHSRTQEEIHELLLSFAEVGANVVRLKGGDPLVFGRGGEEMDFLQQKGIQVKVIPGYPFHVGITAASGIAAELGVPLTHRGVANSVRFLTGHSRKGGADPLFVAENAADPDSTLVVYMGLSTLPSLVSKLIQHGLPPDTPAAAVERGTTPQQRIVLAELKDLADKITSEEFVSPTLIFIGKVVALSPLWPQHCSQESECLIPHRLGNGGWLRIRAVNGNQFCELESPKKDYGRNNENHGERVELTQICEIYFFEDFGGEEIHKNFNMYGLCKMCDVNTGGWKVSWLLGEMKKMEESPRFCKVVAYEFKLLKGADDLKVRSPSVYLQLLLVSTAWFSRFGTKFSGNQPTLLGSLVKTIAMVTASTLILDVEETQFLDFDIFIVVSIFRHLDGKCLGTQGVVSGSHFDRYLLHRFWLLVVGTWW
ncbi:urophorphyrin methylase 1 [Artemisia annua]|uniref:uroporphyrinogen-III C-methyltransferase n=1 Tax=Artemisia annua TaxID=35608 RepID=A0A2U1KQD2_ARTAN|nr:urophorphyrin methylase 1 [Artemisia annua]